MQIRSLGLLIKSSSSYLRARSSQIGGWKYYSHSGLLRAEEPRYFWVPKYSGPDTGPGPRLVMVNPSTGTEYRKTFEYVPRTCTGYQTSLISILKYRDTVPEKSWKRKEYWEIWCKKQVKCVPYPYILPCWFILLNMLTMILFGCDATILC